LAQNWNKYLKTHCTAELKIILKRSEL
jgi:hypothetical protein